MIAYPPPTTAAQDPRALLASILARRRVLTEADRPVIEAYVEQRRREMAAEERRG